MIHHDANTDLTFSGVLLCLILLGICTTASAAKMYKWVDDNGNIRYSDRMPASQAKLEHQTLNSQGMVVSTKKAAKTPQKKEVKPLKKMVTVDKEKSTPAVSPKKMGVALDKGKKNEPKVQRSEKKLEVEKKQTHKNKHAKPHLHWPKRPMKVRFSSGFYFLTPPWTTNGFYLLDGTVAK